MEWRLDSACAEEKVKALELQVSSVKDVVQKMDTCMKKMTMKDSYVALQQTLALYALECT